jgi:hypothetical protein
METEEVVIWPEKPYEIITYSDGDLDMGPASCADICDSNGIDGCLDYLCCSCEIAPIFLIKQAG